MNKAVLQRQDMIAFLRLEGIRDKRILDVMGKIPRHLFLPKGCRDLAYEPTAVHIACDQTMTKPYMVALMTHILDLQPHHTVLEIGTGSGYHAAVLSRLCRHVYTIERHEILAFKAEGALNRVRCNNVTLDVRDGTRGWPEHAPFDRIICAAAGPTIPREWLAQLKDGGRIVMPIATAPDEQHLCTIEKNGASISITRMGAAQFVPLVGTHGQEEKEA